MTEPEDDDVLTCSRCLETGSYIEWLKDEIAAGETRIVIEADATTADVQQSVMIELAVHRGADGGLARLEAVGNVIKSAA